MTKDQAKEIKKVIRLVGNFKMIYISKTEELRVRVATYMTKDSPGAKAEAEEKINKNLALIFAVLSKSGYIPKYRIDYKQYEHIINDYFIVFQ